LTHVRRRAERTDRDMTTPAGGVKSAEQSSRKIMVNLEEASESLAWSFGINRKST